MKAAPEPIKRAGRRGLPTAFLALAAACSACLAGCRKDDTGQQPSLTTLEVSQITTTTASCGGFISDEGSGAVTARGVVWGTAENPDTGSSLGMTNEGAGPGQFESQITGLSPGTGYYVRAYATNTAGTSYGGQQGFSTRPADGSRGVVSDIDGNQYETVVIGDQEWMAENLRTTRYRDASPIQTDLSNAEWLNTREGAYAVYPHQGVDGIDSEAAMVAAYGKLYNWYAVTDPRGLCPEGWHTPSKEEWEQLSAYVMDALGLHNDWLSTGLNGLGNALKSCRQKDSPLGGDCASPAHPRWDAHATHHGNDHYGFSALPAGWRRIDGQYYHLGLQSHWWTSKPMLSSTAWNMAMHHSRGSVEGYNHNNNRGYSLRCVRLLD